eukprot:s402_g3.t1
MFTAAESALSGFTQAEYEAIDFLDVPFSVVAPSTPVARRHEYITLDRLIRLGATPGCKACKFDATVHTPARFDGLIKAEKIAASKSVRDAAPPDVERPDPSAESAPAACEGDAEAPERASSSAGPSAPAGVVVQSSENKVLADEFGLSARSTPEAEMISMASALFSEVINLQTFLQSVSKDTVPIIFFQDNETVLAILKSGYSPKLRHLGRVHRVNVASMAEIFEQEDFSATYVNSKDQLANGLTKVIPPAEWPEMLTQLCLSNGSPHAATVSKVVIEEAERFASSLSRKVTQEDLLQLMTYLPGESAMRPSANEASCFTTGAFAHGGGIAGLRQNVALFPVVFQCTAVQIFLQKRGFEAWDAGFYLAPAVASCCLVTSLIMEWPALIADQQVWLLFDQLPLLMMSGAVGVVVNLSSLLVIKFTSSLMAKLLVIVRSSALVLFFFALGEDFTWIQVGGYAFTIVAFTGYSIVKAHDMDKAEEDKADKAAKLLQMMEEGKSPEEQALVQAGVTIEEEPAKMREAGNFSDLDLTSGMFWFAFLIVLASAYQAFVLGEIKFPVPDRAFVGVATPGNVPPVPYMPLTSLKQDIPLRQKQALLASSVESSAKVLYLEDGRFLARQGSSAPGPASVSLCGPDVVQKLVDEAAAVLEMHTPSLPGASRRSSPLMAKASPLMKSADLVSSAVADAASAAEASPEGKAPEICGTPSPWQNHSHSRQEFMCATPSPWQGSAVVNPEITAKLLAMGQQKGSDGSVQDPVAMIVASAAAAANKDPPVPPPAQAPPAQYSKAAMSPQVAPPLRLPRIESGIGVIEEGDNTFPHSASSDPEIAPDLQAMAASFASLVKPEQPGAESVQWWQPMKETLSIEEEAGILDFIQRWGLDENCDRVLRNLPSHVRQEVLASFLASADTRNVSAKFMSWLSSRMRNFEEIQCALVTTPEERKAFYEKWRLDQKCRQLVEEQAPSVQRELISNFNPPPGTKNVAGRMTAFLNMILNKTRFRGSGGANSPSKHQAGKGGRNAAQESFGDQEHADKVSEFVARWGLDNGARSALLTLPPEAQQAAMDGFSPSMSTECTSRRFIAYLRSAKPHLNRKGKSGGKGRQQKVYSEPPLEPGLMLQPQRVAVVATGPMTMMPN